MNSELETDVSPVQTIPETAKQLGIGVNQAYEAAKTGEIPTFRIGRRILVSKIALQKKIESAA